MQMFEKTISSAKLPSYPRALVLSKNTLMWDIYKLVEQSKKRESYALAKLCLQHFGLKVLNIL